jgi:hypothetical protein
MYTPVISTRQVSSRYGINSFQAVSLSFIKKMRAARKHINSHPVFMVMNIICFVN